MALLFRSKRGKQDVLLEAARDGEVGNVHRCLAAGVSVHCKDEDGDTPLHYAAASGRKEVVALLLGAGAAVDAANKDGHAPLHAAAEKGHKEVAVLLLGAGAVVDAATEDGCTPLHGAVIHGHKEVAELLLGVGAAVDATNKSGFTPLHYAAKEGRKEVAELLLGAGPAVDAATKDDWTPLHLAVHTGHTEVVGLLLGAGAAVGAADKSGFTPLHCASTEGRKEVAELLLGAGPAVDAADKDGWTPLHCAAYKGHKEVVGLLVGAGAAVDAANKDDKTPLNLAAWSGHQEVVALLLGAGPAVDAADKQQEQQLMYGGGTVTIPASAVKGSLAGLLQVVQVAGNMVIANPASLFEKVILLAQSVRDDALVGWCTDRAARANERAAALPGALMPAVVGMKILLGNGLLGDAHEAALWCMESAARAGERAATMVPALQALQAAVLAPGQRVEARLLESISITLLLLAKALLQMKQLLLQFQLSRHGGMTKLMLHVLNAPGFKREFQEKEQELRDCLVQLSTTVNTVMLTSQARVGDVVRDQREQATNWPQQNERDQRADMQQQPERLMLQDGRAPSADECCAQASEANKAHPGAIMAAFTAAAAPAPKDPAELLRQVALTSSSSLLEDVRKVDSALIAAGVQFAFVLVGSAVTANPLGLIKAVADVLTTAVGAAEAVMYCKTKATRISSRLSALVPALGLFHTALLQHAAIAATQQQQLQTLNDNLLCLLKVLLDLKQLLDSFRGGGSNSRSLTWQFLTGRGYQQEFNEVDGELQACVAQLTAVMHFFQFAQQAAENAAGLEVGEWGDQNDQDWKEDMTQLEGQVLQVVGGMEGLKEMLSSQAVALDGQAATLQLVAEWLQAMQAPSTAIAAHLEQVSQQLGNLQITVEQRFDDVDSALQAVLAYMSSHQQAVPGPQQQQQQQPPPPRPVFVIPRSEIQFSEADLTQAAGGAFGRVVKAARDQGYVAVKIYRHQGLGNRDRKRVVHEALLLARASHQNVVRCFGVVHDPDNPNDPSNIDGSLVMEWVHGGDLYKWLQANDNSSFRERLTLAAQVAAGMRYLHENRMVHGDLKPQNVMLQPSPAGGVPEAKICDFGLAKHAATTTANYTPATKAYTLEYTSPTRLQQFKRSYEDDVYAFGILMYFIASCDSPFHDIDRSRLHDAILAGLRPNIDEWAEEEVAAGPVGLGGVVAAYCQLAKQCWHHDPEKRPAFAAAIYPQLTALLQQCP